MGEKHRIKEYGLREKAQKAVGSRETVMSRTTVASNVELLLRWIPAFAGMTIWGLPVGVRRTGRPE